LCHRTRFSENPTALTGFPSRPGLSSQTLPPLSATSEKHLQQQCKPQVSKVGPLPAVTALSYADGSTCLQEFQHKLHLVQPPGYHHPVHRWRDGQHGDPQRDEKEHLGAALQESVAHSQAAIQDRVPTIPPIHHLPVAGHANNAVLMHANVHEVPALALPQASHHDNQDSQSARTQPVSHCPQATIRRVVHQFHVKFLLAELLTCTSALNQLCLLNILAILQVQSQVYPQPPAVDNAHLTPSECSSSILVPTSMEGEGHPMGLSVHTLTFQHLQLLVVEHPRAKDTATIPAEVSNLHSSQGSTSAAVQPTTDISIPQVSHVNNHLPQVTAFISLATTVERRHQSKMDAVHGVYVDKLPRVQADHGTVAPHCTDVIYAVNDIHKALTSNPVLKANIVHAVAVHLTDNLQSDPATSIILRHLAFLPEVHHHQQVARVLQVEYVPHHVRPDSALPFLGWHFLQSWSQSETDSRGSILQAPKLHAGQHVPHPHVLQYQYQHGQVPHRHHSHLPHAQQENRISLKPASFDPDTQFGYQYTSTDTFHTCVRLPHFASIGVVLKPLHPVPLHEPHVPHVLLQAREPSSPLDRHQVLHSGCPYPCARHQILRTALPGHMSVTVSNLGIKLHHDCVSSLQAPGHDDSELLLPILNDPLLVLQHRTYTTQNYRQFRLYLAHIELDDDLPAGQLDTLHTVLRPGCLTPHQWHIHLLLLGNPHQQQILWHVSNALQVGNVSDKIKSDSGFTSLRLACLGHTVPGPHGLNMLEHLLTHGHLAGQLQHQACYRPVVILEFHTQSHILRQVKASNSETKLSLTKYLRARHHEMCLLKMYRSMLGMAPTTFRMFWYAIIALYSMFGLAQPGLMQPNSQCD
jgi:hypothetical protein